MIPFLRREDNLRQHVWFLCHFNSINRIWNSFMKELQWQKLQFSLFIRHRERNALLLKLQQWSQILWQVQRLRRWSRSEINRICHFGPLMFLEPSNILCNEPLLQPVEQLFDDSEPRRPVCAFSCSFQFSHGERALACDLIVTCMARWLDNINCGFVTFQWSKVLTEILILLSKSSNCSKHSLFVIVHAPTLLGP